MVVMSASGVGKSYGVRTVLEGVSFNVEEGDRVGVLGVNGAGKTTLFKLISGEEAPDVGSIHFSKKIAHMHQYAEYTSEKTVLEEVISEFESLIAIGERLTELERQLESTSDENVIRRYHSLNEEFIERGGLTYEARARSALIGLGFEEEELSLSLSAVSGGQRTRVLLAKLLLGEASVLLLDEPTNHLDIKAVAWLENFLASYKGTLLIISHDRFFLDKLVNKVFEIEGGKLNDYRGNYTQFAEKKRALKNAAIKEYTLKQKEIKRIEGIITQQKQWNRERNIVMARSKQKVIDRIERDLVKPEEDPESLKFLFSAIGGSGNDVILGENLGVSFDGEPLFSGVNIDIKRGEKVFIVGDNGCGKTTLLRVLTSERIPDEGEVYLGSRVKVGYYDQAQSDLDPNKTALETINDALPSLNLGTIRNALAAFLFKGDDVNKRIEMLSGGERARVALTRLMLQKCNLLIMDEPTNHLDIASKEALEEALLAYDGTLIIVSHDRYFMNRLATKTYAMNDGALILIEGVYTPELEQKTVAPRVEKVTDYKIKKEKNSQERRIRGAISRLEDNIATLENKSAKITEDMAQQSTNYEKIMELTQELSKIESEIHSLYEEWENMSKLLEEE